MYVFSQRGILSIVAHTSKPKLLVVRAPACGDLQHFWPTARTVMTGDHDYRYRAFLPRQAVADRIAEAVESIDYFNVKESVAADRQLTYLRVWSNIMDLQEAYSA